MKLFILPFKENTIWQDFNGGFKYIYIYIEQNLNSIRKGKC